MSEVSLASRWDGPSLIVDIDVHRGSGCFISSVTMEIKLLLLSFFRILTLFEGHIR
jgi:hypothetical protein